MTPIKRRRRLWWSFLKSSSSTPGHIVRRQGLDRLLLRRRIVWLYPCLLHLHLHLHLHCTISINRVFQGTCGTHLGVPLVLRFMRPRIILLRQPVSIQRLIFRLVMEPRRIRFIAPILLVPCADSPRATRRNTASIRRQGFA